MFWQLILGIGVVACTLGTTEAISGEGPEFASVKEKTRRALLQIKNYPAMKFKITYDGYSSRGSADVEIRGNNMWVEGDSVNLGPGIVEADVMERTRLLRQVTGCNMPHRYAYDGKFKYDFSPERLELAISPQKLLAVNISFDASMPGGWIGFQANTQSFLNMLTAKFGELSSKLEPNGVWRVSQENIQPNVQKVSLRNRYIVIDPKINHLVTECGGNGGVLGNYIGKFDWAQKDGRWYVKHGKLTSERNVSVVRAEWTIGEISFDAKQLRAKFTIDKADVPFGTKIITYAGRVGSKVVSEEYVGGEAGKEEHRLKYIALSKIRMNR